MTINRAPTTRFEKNKTTIEAKRAAANQSALKNATMIDNPFELASEVTPRDHKTNVTALI